MKIYLKSGGVTLQITLSENLYLQLSEFKFLFDYIPDASIEVAKETKFDGSLVVSESHNFHFEYFESSGSLAYPPHIVSKHDIVTLFEHTLELLREEKGIYCLHGSSVSKESKGVWFLGPISGLGKTTLALNLCLNKKFSFIGDEKILIDNDLVIKSGIKNINYNKKELFQSVKQNLQGLDKEMISKIIQIEVNNVPLKLIVLPILMSNSTGLEIQKWDEQKASFHIYEELSRKIRGVSRRVGSFSIPIQSFDNVSASNNRSDLANKISKTIPCYLIKGNSEEVEREVSHLLG